QVDVLLKRPTDRNQEAPERDVIGNARPADGAEVDGVVPGNLGQAVGGHHRPGLGETLAGPVEPIPGVAEVEAAADGLQHADAFRYHLVADAVTGDDGDPHRVGFCFRCRHPSCSTQELGFTGRLPAWLSACWQPPFSRTDRPRSWRYRCWRRRFPCQTA